MYYIVHTPYYATIVRKATVLTGILLLLGNHQLNISQYIIYEANT